MVYDTTLKEVKVLDATGVVNCVGFSPDGKYLASGDSNRNVYVFDVSSWELVRTGEESLR
jgi:WD40 repeat protein